MNRWMTVWLTVAALAALPCGSTAAQFAEVPAVAVIYFDNATGLDHLSWLPKGFADSLIRDLAATGRLNVVPRNQVEHAMATYSDLKSTAFVNKLIALRMAKILGVPYLIAGRFSRRDTDLIIEIKIYDTKQQRQTGWRQIEGPSDALPDLEKQAALKIVELLDIHLDDHGLIELLQIPTRSLKALAYYSMALDAIDRDDRDQARSYFQSSIDADKFFRPAIGAISGMAFVMSGKAILRAETSETAVLGASSIQSVDDLLELARANAFDFVIGEPSTTPIADDTARTNVKVPLQFSVRPDYVNLWLYAIRRIGRDTAAAGPDRKLTFVRQDLFDNPVSIGVPEPVAGQWLSGWQNLRMHLVFQNRDGAVLFESPREPVLPLYIGNAEGQFETVPSAYWKVDTAFEIESVPKEFFEEPLTVGLEIDR